jgi:hypothetical protein
MKKSVLLHTTTLPLPPQTNNSIPSPQNFKLKVQILLNHKFHGNQIVMGKANVPLTIQPLATQTQNNALQKLEPCSQRQELCHTQHPSCSTLLLKHNTLSSTQFVLNTITQALTNPLFFTTPHHNVTPLQQPRNNLIPQQPHGQHQKQATQPLAILPKVPKNIGSDAPLNKDRITRKSLPPS